MSNSSNRSRRSRRSQKRSATSMRARTAELAAVHLPELPAASPTSDTNAWDDSHSQLPASRVTPDVQPPVIDPFGEIDAPTIILTPEQISMLSRTPPPPPALPPTVPPLASDFAYDPQNDSPTIVLDVAALLTARPEQQAPLRSQSAVPMAPVRPPPPPMPASGTPTVRRADRQIDPEEDFARLRRQRLEREEIEPEESPLASRFKQWWEDLQPGLDRVLGRTHHGGMRGARDTVRQTSAQLPAVHLRPRSEQPQAQPRSPAARELGQRAQTAATPALERLHNRAERVAQALVDRLDEHLGGRPPMQHVLLGPGRMIVSFSPSISIRDAQIIIASVQARSLRRLVGYNAYLVLVPPGREAMYAERLHAYREVTGVHFGPAHAPAADRARVATQG